jgi:hypothetical protein
VAARVRRCLAVGVLAALTAVVGAGPAVAQTETTVAAVDPAAVPVDPAATVAATTTPPTTIGATTTTQRPATCDAVPPTVAQFVGTVTATGADSIRFRVDELRSGAAGDSSVQVLFVRDARFLKDGHRYLVTASLDTDTKLLVSKVRTKRGEDPRCTAKDPIYTRNVDGTTVDSGVFAGMKGHSRDVLMAFLRPLGAVLAVLLALVIVKYVLYFGGKGIRRLVSGPAR